VGQSPQHGAHAIERGIDGAVLGLRDVAARPRDPRSNGHEDRRHCTPPTARSDEARRDPVLVNNAEIKLGIAAAWPASADAPSGRR
jgi:hypothetical protein